jgi:hypothetical protein
MKIWALLLVSFFLSGCCSFVPCHPGTKAIGHVTNLNGRPIEGAVVTLYGSEEVTDAEGCFRFELADALPFVLTVTASDYKRLEVHRKIGTYNITVNLAPINSAESSSITWTELGSYEYGKMKGCL